MIRSTRRLFLLLLTTFLITSCSIALPIGNKPAAPTQSQGINPNACPASLHLPATCLSPQAIRQAYEITNLYQKGYTGKGQSIVDIVSFGSPTLQSDMQVYDRTFGLPALDLQVISPLQAPKQDPHPDKEGWASETTLDVQIIHALAPDARVVVLVSPVSETEGTIGLPEMRQLEQYAIDNKLGNIVTQSWGASELTLENAQGQAEIQKWNNLLRTGTIEHRITYLASSGDNGATDYSDLQATKLGTVPTTSFTADLPWVTAVGGTSLQMNNGNRQETAWSNSGGGFSRFYSTPDYQKTLPTTTQEQFQNRRGVPDVSAVADPFTGIAIYTQGSWTLAGGTSASAPIWAAIVAIGDQMAGRPLGFINPALYKIAASSSYHQAFHDITTGNNNAGKVKGYTAQPGWDAVTGLGTPDVQNLLPALIADTK